MIKDIKGLKELGKYIKKVVDGETDKLGKVTFYSSVDKDGYSVFNLERSKYKEEFV